MSQQHSNTVLYFTPALPCQRVDDCPILTHFAIIGELEFTPGCAVHGYCYGVPLQDEYASVERFVLNEKDGIGSATVLAPCDPSEAPGYTKQHDMPESDLAWSVRYTHASGNHSTVFVVWCCSCLEFYLHEQE